MDANPHTPVDFRSPEALRVWCILAGLALVPLPALHALPEGFLVYLTESRPPGWFRLTKTEIFNFTLLCVPLAPIFLLWSLPGAGRPGLPTRSVAILCLLAAYHPYRLYIEKDIYGTTIVRLVTEISQGWPILWMIEHLDTPLLIGLAATALLRRHTLRPVGKLLFHWGLFVCALWATGVLYDSIFFDIILFRTFGF